VVLGVVVGLSCLLVIASLGPARQARRTQPAPLLRED
jgi:ABC-type lipoprotein release transport system permease subunit